MRGVDPKLKRRLDSCIAFRDCINDSTCHQKAEDVLTVIMQRAKANVQTIVSRLSSAGYIFKYPGQAHVFPIPDIDERIAQLESLGAIVPLSLKTWFKIVGSVVLIGSHPEWKRPGYLSGHPLQWIEPWYADPLVVTHELLDVAVNEWSFGSRELQIAPDAAHKANISGGAAYELSIDEPVVDTILRYEPHNVNFVDYLRIAFWWGGFPGVEKIPEFPISFIEELRKDLLPI